MEAYAIIFFFMVPQDLILLKEIDMVTFWKLIEVLGEISSHLWGGVSPTYNRINIQREILIPKFSCHCLYSVR